MKKLRFIPVLLFAAISCSPLGQDPDAPVDGLLSLSDVAKIMSELPLSEENLDEVYMAVSSSSGNGYDEEYTMSSLFSAPGSGVGDDSPYTKAAAVSRPLKDLFAEYFASSKALTKSASDVEAYLNALSSSDMQIYWPYSDAWDGSSFPLVTFDPGQNAESNYGYEIRYDDRGVKVVDSVLVTEELAMKRPVWVINRNADASYTPVQFFETKATAPPKGGRMLMIKDFTAYRHYDSWFAGASEFIIRSGAVDGFKAATDDELRKYSPTVTDFVMVVKRKDIGRKLPLNAIMLADLTDQMETLALLITEDDGGTTTNWKCSANVKYNSKSYGFDIDIPYRSRDDIVWRGPVPASFFGTGGTVNGRFGDVGITFELR